MSAQRQYPSDKQEQFVVRFPDGLRDRIKLHAENHGRSMNTEMVRVLEREFPETPVSSAKGSWEGPPLRDWFAGHAVGSLLTELYQQCRDRRTLVGNVYQVSAAAAYELADAMIAEREKGGAK